MDAFEQTPGDSGRTEEPGVLQAAGSQSRPRLCDWSTGVQFRLYWRSLFPCVNSGYCPVFFISAWSSPFNISYRSADSEFSPFSSIWECHNFFFIFEKGGMSQVVVIPSSPRPPQVVMRKRREAGRKNVVWCVGLLFLDDWLYVGDLLHWSRTSRQKIFPWKLRILAGGGVDEYG